MEKLFSDAKNYSVLFKTTCIIVITCVKKLAAILKIEISLIFEIRKVYAGCIEKSSLFREAPQCAMFFLLK